MRKIWSIYRRELLGYFLSPIAYVILFVFLMVNGITFYFFITTLDGHLEATINSQYGFIPFWFLALLIPPLLTMRCFAEEKRTGTFELLVTTGVGEWTLVLGKFFAAWTLYLFLWATFMPPFLLLEWLGDLDWGIIACVHGGLALLGLLLCSGGILISSLTQNQLIAASASMACNLVLFFASFFRHLFAEGSLERRYFDYISPLYHFSADYTHGTFDLRYLVVYGSASLFGLFLAVKSLERRRWW